MAEERTDIAAIFEKMKEEVRAAGPADRDVTPAQVRLSVRDQAERMWAISADRPVVGKGGVIKRFLRPLMRWYVEPAFADQRAFNDAVLKLIDDLDERIARLEHELRIAVCRPQVPYTYGGAEVVADQLVDELRIRGHEVDLIAVPYAWIGARVLDQALIWRMIEVNQTPGKPTDLVMATKFPSYGIRHPNKVVWLVHQFRQAYDFDRGEFGQYSESPPDRATRLGVERYDKVALGEAKRIFTISGNVADRLKRYSGLDATVLPPPPQRLDYRTTEYDGFVLSVNRLDRYKRIDLLIDAAKKSEPGMKIVIVGDGPDRGRLEKLASSLNGRVEFAGRVDGEQLADLYARCLAVYYAPVDEDYGMVPYEAFLSAKPVVTTVDAGGPLEVVHDGETGVVVAADPAEIARACAHLAAHVEEAKRLGEAGKAVAERITWDTCIDALLS